jgi:hypothetical protein
MATRCMPCAFCAWRAAIAAVSKGEAHRLRRLGVMPGRRTAQKALSALPVATASTAWSAAPIARIAASHDPGETVVSMSTRAIPSAGTALRIIST